MRKELALGTVLALACLGATPAPPSSPSYAALACANPALPQEILDGGAARSERPPLYNYNLIAPAATIHVALAGDFQTRETGLMCVTRLRPRSGMIFVFERSDDYEFWMKNTLIPLDMIWLEKDGTITNVAANVPASTLSTPDEKIARRRGHGMFVIELPGGEAVQDGIVKGAKIEICPDGTPMEHLDGGYKQCWDGDRYEPTPKPSRSPQRLL